MSGTLAPPTSECPVCQAENPSTAAACRTCGYPAALAVDALRGLSETEAVPVRGPVAKPKPAPTRTSKPSGRDATSEQVERVAAEIEETSKVVARLGVPTAEIAPELHQAALTQADGRAVEALSLLRSARARLHETTNDALGRRLRSLDDRQKVLRDEGVAVSMGAEAGKIRAEIDAGRAAQAIDRLVEADEQLGRIEADWRGLKGLLRQIDELRDSAEVVGRPVADVEEAVAQIRTLLAQPDLSTDTLDEGAQLAARALMLLNEALQPAIEQELARHGQALESYPSDDLAARSARTIHGEAIRHLRRGKMVESTARLRELRGAIRELSEAAAAAKAAAPEEPESEPAAAPEPESIENALPRLLQKARGLAARVRALPTESELAYEAAGEIRRATEQLRARKLEDAEATLSRLMRTLDAEVPLEP